MLEYWGSTGPFELAKKNSTTLSTPYWDSDGPYPPLVSSGFVPTRIFKVVPTDVVAIIERIAKQKSVLQIIHEFVRIIEIMRFLESPVTRYILRVQEVQAIIETRTRNFSFVRIIRELLGIIESKNTQALATFDDGLFPDWVISPDWTIVSTGSPHTPLYHAKSGSISINQSSAMTVAALTTHISFWWYSSCNASNFGEFYIDGVQQTEINGITSYAQYSVSGLTNTVHVFEWRYAKTVSTVTGDDAIYVDDIAVGPDHNTPTTNAFYTFESGLSDITTSGDANWATSTSQAYQGTHSVKTGSITNSQSTTLQLIAKTNQIGFWMRGSSETTNDPLIFKVDGISKWVGSGTGKYNRDGWAFIFYNGLSPTYHTFTWTYSKNPSTSSGTDGYFLDYVQYRELAFTLFAREVVAIVESTKVKSSGVLALLRFVAERVGIVETSRRSRILRRVQAELEAIVEASSTSRTIIRIKSELVGILETVVRSLSVVTSKPINEVVGIIETPLSFKTNAIVKAISEVVGVIETRAKTTARITRRIFAWIS